MTPSDLRRQIKGGFALGEDTRSRYVTKQRAGAYFEADLANWTARRLRVSHLLLRPSSKDARSAEELMRRRGRSVGKSSRARSPLPTPRAAIPLGPAQGGGPSGWIGRRGPMDESFSGQHLGWKPARSANRFDRRSASTSFAAMKSSPAASGLGTCGGNREIRAPGSYEEARPASAAVHARRISRQLALISSPAHNEPPCAEAGYRTGVSSQVGQNAILQGRMHPAPGACPSDRSFNQTVRVAPVLPLVA